MFAVFSYYLSSPLNLLVYFFEKSDLTDFFDLIVSLKLSLSAAAFVAFLQIRFRRKILTLQHNLLTVLLSVCYALSQYSIAQSSNIMWLDGVCMLPLVLLGVYLLSSEGRVAPLSASVALSVLFNWYSGGINCAFAGCWFIFEMSLASENCESRFLYFVKNSLRFLLAILSGILISGILFFPTVGGIAKSAKGTLSAESLFDLSFIGNIVQLIRNYAPGAESELGSVSLYCGSLPLIGCICLLFSKDIPFSRRIKYLSLFFFTILIFIWNPLVTVFSLFKQVDSFWYRYSYIGIFSLIFLSACYFLDTNLTDIRRISLICGICLTYINVLRLFYASSVVTVLISSVLVMLCSFLIGFVSDNKQHHHNRRTGFAFLSVVILCELVLNASLLMDIYHLENRSSRSSYYQASEVLWNSILKNDIDEYRIAQTYTFNTVGGISANFNEPLAFNYRGITSYTSSPDQKSIDFMNNIGYPKYVDTLNEITEPILGAYSLLGVKYVSSQYSLPFLKTSNFFSNDSSISAVYENTYAFPLAFRYIASSDEITYEGNPFEYQNALFRELSGTDDDLYSPVGYSISRTGNEILYSLDVPEYECVLYGNLIKSAFPETRLYINGNYKSDYGGWLSSSVFYVPVENGQADVLVCEPPEAIFIDPGERTFYALRINLLRKIADNIRSRGADVIDIENGKACFCVESEGNENLLISIPYDSDWIVTNNGKEAEFTLFGECLYSVSLVKGTNEISLTYHVRYFSFGMLCTISGILLLVIEVFLFRKNRNKLLVN